MDKQKIKEILFKESDNLQDAILNCLTNLNLLTTFTPDELGMTEQEIEVEMKNEKAMVDKFIAAKQIMDKWLQIINENLDVGNFNERLLKDCPWIENYLNR